MLRYILGGLKSLGRETALGIVIADNLESINGLKKKQILIKLKKTQKSQADTDSQCVFNVYLRTQISLGSS